MVVDLPADVLQRPNMRVVLDVHAPNGTQSDIATTVICDCGAYVGEDTARATGGACIPCFRAGLSGRTKRLEVRTLAGVIDLPSRPPPSDARRRRDRAKQRRRASDPTRAAAVAARKAALRRLRDCFRPVYEMLLADERAARGLEPFTTPALVNHADGETASKTLEWAEVYSALEGSKHAHPATDDPPAVP